MTDQPEQNSDDIKERRLAKSFGLHRKIQDTLDDQEKERVSNIRYAIIGAVILALIVLYVLFRWLTSDTIIVS